MAVKKSLASKRIVAGISGSIAAFKAAEVVSQLVQRGAQVDVVMTPAATKFVGPMTFQALTRRRVITDPFDLDAVTDASHVTVSGEADLVLVAPATANLLAKMAHGIADDALTSLLLAAAGPVLVAPAMNDRMWKHAATQANLATLRKRGIRFVDPGEGFLACGTYAVGRLAEPADILAAVEKLLR